MNNTYRRQRAARRESARALIGVDRGGRVDSCWISATGGGGTSFRPAMLRRANLRDTRSWLTIVSFVASTPETYPFPMLKTLAPVQVHLRQPLLDLLAFLSAGAWVDETMTDAVCREVTSAGPTTANRIALLQQSAAKLLSTADFDRNFEDVVNLLRNRRAADHQALAAELFETGSVSEARILEILTPPTPRAPPKAPGESSSESSTK